MTQALSGIEGLVEQPWRLEPHTFAAHVSGGRWRAWNYLTYIGERLAEAVVNGGGRLIINMPPGHGKSEFLSHWVPTWFLDNLPQQKVITASHGAELAETFGRVVRNEFEQNPFLTTKLSEDSTAAGRWNTPEGGGMSTFGVGSGMTGFRGNLLLLDDPHPTWEAAYSHTHRQRAIEWFEGTFYDRLEPNGTIVVLAHRWHDGDLAGHLISHHADPWQVIRLPALAELGDPLGREVGEALCPERYDVAALEQARRASPLVFAAKYQQNPLGLGSDRVYDRFVPADHEDKTLVLADRLPLQASFDFNRNPGMHVELGQYDPARDLFTAVHEIHGPFMKLTVALDELQKLVKAAGGFRWSELQVYADATGSQERAETTETALDMISNRLKKLGWPFRMRVPRGNPPIKTRIDTFNDALRDGDGEIHYKVHPRCERLIADLKELKTDEQGLIDKRESKLSHASDAEGYRVHYLRPIRRAAQAPRERPAVLISR